MPADPTIGRISGERGARTFARRFARGARAAAGEAGRAARTSRVACSAIGRVRGQRHTLGAALAEPGGARCLATARRAYEIGIADVPAGAAVFRVAREIQAVASASRLSGGAGDRRRAEAIPGAAAVARRTVRVSLAARYDRVTTAADQGEQRQAQRERPKGALAHGGGLSAGHNRHVACYQILRAAQRSETYPHTRPPDIFKLTKNRNALSALARATRLAREKPHQDPKRAAA